MTGWIARPPSSSRIALPACLSRRPRRRHAHLPRSESRRRQGDGAARPGPTLLPRSRCAPGSGGRRNRAPRSAPGRSPAPRPARCPWTRRSRSHPARCTPPPPRRPARDARDTPGRCTSRRSAPGPGSQWPAGRRGAHRGTRTTAVVSGPRSPSVRRRHRDPLSTAVPAVGAETSSRTEGPRCARTRHRPRGHEADRCRCRNSRLICDFRRRATAQWQALRAPPFHGSPAEAGAQATP